MSLTRKIRKFGWALTHGKTAARAINSAYKRAKSEESRKERLKEQAEIIRNSALFDEEWFLRNHIEFQKQGIDAAEEYLLRGSSRMCGKPSLYFCGEEYYDLNWDVQNSQMNPLLHYEMHGRQEGRDIYQYEIEDFLFPDTSEELSREFGILPSKHNRIAVLSCFFGSGVIPETLILLIKGLLEVVDNIVLIGDCKVFPEEIKRLNGLVCYARFERHEQYDFGSYKRGLEYIRKNDLLEKTGAEELVFLNDSCLGPIFPFSETYEPMSKHYCDFWGYTDKKLFGYKHLQSFHIVFKKSIIESTLLDDFLTRVEGKCDRGFIIVSCETKLTKYLQDNGMVYASIASEVEDQTVNIFNTPVTYLEEFRVPLIKIKALTRESKEDLNRVVEIIGQNAPEFLDLLPKPSKDNKTHHAITLNEHKKSLKQVESRLRNKLISGEPLNVYFLVTSVSMFSSRSLFDRMLLESNFMPRIIVIPDYRKGSNLEFEMIRCRRELIFEGVDPELISIAQVDSINRWMDVCDEADIVCYNLPYYQATSYRYNPFYSIGRDFLPIMVNYGFYRSLYDRRIMALDAYRVLWKAFFECPDTLDEYQRFSLDGGTNGELVGYIKMDRLKNFAKKESGRKTILVALHHSIEGGANQILSLAHFIEYFDYFTKLPDEYPEIDFIYRPHPFLYDALKKVQGWDENALLSYIREMQTKPNVVWNEKGDYFQAFMDSDACIQDCGSFLVEYFYTGKPCCYMLKDPSDIEAKFAPLGIGCLNQCYLSYNTDDIDEFIKEVVLDGNDPKAESRAQIAERIMVNYPHAANAAISIIERSLLENHEND